MLGGRSGIALLGADAHRDIEHIPPRVVIGARTGLLCALAREREDKTKT